MVSGRSLPRLFIGLAVLLALAACTPYPGPPEAVVAAQVAAEDPVERHLDEMAALDDEELAKRFDALADAVGATRGEFAFDETDDAHQQLRAAFLELGLRSAKLRETLDPAHTVVRRGLETWACAPWLAPLRPSFLPPPVEHAFGTAADEEALGVATGTDDSFAIAGWTEGHLLARNAGGRDAFVCRYGATGTVLWGRQVGGAGDDTGHAVALDAEGNSYLVGQTDDRLAGAASFDVDGFVRKFDANGTSDWTAFIGAAGRADAAYGVAVDGDLVHVVGATQSDLDGRRRGTIDGYLRSFDLGGGVVTTEQFSNGTATYARDVATGSSGDVVLVGSADSGSYSGEEFVPSASQRGFVRTFAAAGGLLWSRSIGSFRNATGNGVAVDGNDDVYVVGSTNDQLGPNPVGRHDAYVRKYDAGGNELWTLQFGTRAFDAAYDVRTDGNGELWVAGATDGVLGAASMGGRDAFLSRLDPGGQGVLWSEQFGAGGDDEAYALALSSRSVAYAVGGAWQQGLFGASRTAFAALRDDSGAAVPW